jgi:hypothetical protein
MNVPRQGMEFSNRLKGELSEAVIRALLIDAGYRVVDFGIESVLREVQCLGMVEYLGLELPDVLRRLPDLLAMDRDQTFHEFVEVKFRRQWDQNLFASLRDQAMIFRKVVLVLIVTDPANAAEAVGASTYLRACRLRYHQGRYEANLEHLGALAWEQVPEGAFDQNNWWAMQPLQNIFEDLRGRAQDQTIVQAIRALHGLFNAA